MNRLLLINLLEKYSHTASELRSKNSIISFIKDNKNCFDRELEEGHITGSAWLLNKQGDKALLMHHKKLNRWFQPGGHADGNPDILAVSIKEAREESGINSIVPVSEKIFDIDVHKIPSNLKEKEHFHYDIRFLLQVNSDEVLHMNEEAKELRWIGKSIEEVMTDDESVVRMFHKWINL